jgi:superfamily II DNA or RNA helicase
MFRLDSISENLTHKKFNVITSQMLSYEKHLEKIYEKKYDHIVIDEAHHSHSPSNKKMIDNLPYKTKILGLTATPERLDGKSLLEIFYNLTYKKTILELIEQGYLCDVQAFKMKTGQNLAKRGKDFRAAELRNLNNETRNNIIKKCVLENCLDLKTLIFCLNVEHSQLIAQTLKNHNLSAACIHGKMNKKERNVILKKFKNGEIQYLTNCQLLTEGFDEPSIECIVIARPTSSKSLYCQMIGRGLRKTENKSICMLYELTDNNHNICTFNIAAKEETKSQEDYRQGIKLTELAKELLNIDESEIYLDKTSVDIFQRDISKIFDKKNIFESEFYTTPPTKYQKNKLLDLNIYVHEDVNFLEAAFLLWKEKLRKKYGNSYSKRK